MWAGEHEADVIEGKAAGRGGDVTHTCTVDRRFRPGETLPLHGGIEVQSQFSEHREVRPEPGRGDDLVEGAERAAIHIKDGHARALPPELARRETRHQLHASGFDQ